MPSLPIKVRYLDETVKRISMPREGDIGIDLYANQDCYLLTEHPVLVSTGVCLELPKGYAFIIKDRSSMSANVETLAGVIDNSYRGEIKIRLNLVNNNFYKINKGDKIAQGIIIKDLNNKFFIQEVEELSNTDRGFLGFGSTGK